MFRNVFQKASASFAVVAMTFTTATAQDGTQHVMKGNVLKYQQRLGHLVEPPAGVDPDFYHGENIPSDVDWNKVMDPSPTIIPPNWVIADDFQDEFNSPVVSVRWWGSYFGPTFGPDPSGNIEPIFGPGSEDGYVISFFTDIPVGAPTPEFPDGTPYSQPGDLLGTYTLNFDDVWVDPTPYIGWDDHQIFEYKANLMDAHLDHPSDLADQMGFHQRAGEIYWISIMAEVGHRLTGDPATGTDWEFEDTGKFAEPNPANAEGHFWGWHTSPDFFNDVATMGHLRMPGQDWIFDDWEPIQPEHFLTDMAFELYTVPEPGNVGLLVIFMGVACLRRQRR